MHIEAREFTEFVRTILPRSFHNVRVLDAGGGDINGNNRFLFSWANSKDASSQYVCNDIGPAPNVTIVSTTKDLPFPDKHFNTIISTECFEHDAQYAESLRKIVALLSDGGLFVFTCASTGRPEHGTRRTTPHDSWGTIGHHADFQDYYKNLTIDDIAKVLQLDSIFEHWSAYYHTHHHDLFFIGLKPRADGVAQPGLPPCRMAHIKPVTPS